MKQKPKHKIPQYSKRNFPCYISLAKFNRLMTRLSPLPMKLFPRVYKLASGEIIKLDQQEIHIFGISATLDFHLSLNGYLNHNIFEPVQDYLTFYSDLRVRLNKYKREKDRLALSSDFIEVDEQQDESYII